jgi:hypothetical protein
MVYSLLSVDGVLYAGTAPGGAVFKSEDGGATWAGTGYMADTDAIYTMITGYDAIYSGTGHNGEVFKNPLSAAIRLNAPSFGKGATFTADFILNKAITRRFKAYAVIVLPNGNFIDAITFSRKLQPVASNVPHLNAPFSYSLLRTMVPSGVPNGKYEIVVGFFDQDKPVKNRRDAFLEASATFIIE